MVKEVITVMDFPDGPTQMSTYNHQSSHPNRSYFIHCLSHRGSIIYSCLIKGFKTFNRTGSNKYIKSANTSYSIDTPIHKCARTHTHTQRHTQVLSAENAEAQGVGWVVQFQPGGSQRSKFKLN